MEKPDWLRGPRGILRGKKEERRERHIRREERLSPESGSMGSWENARVSSVREQSAHISSLGEAEVTDHHGTKAAAGKWARGLGGVLDVCVMLRL